MGDPLRRLLIITVLVSFTFSSSAQNAISSEDNALGDITQSLGVCIPGTKRCNSAHPNSGIHFLAEDSDREENTSKFSTICDPNTKLCKDSHTGKFDIANSPIEASGEQDASTSKPDPIIHGEEEIISSLVCDPRKGSCQDPHHGFGIAQPRNEAA